VFLNYHLQQHSLIVINYIFIAVLLHVLGAQLEVWQVPHAALECIGCRRRNLRVLISTLAHEKRISNVELNGFACEATQTPIGHGFTLKVAFKRIIKIKFPIFFYITDFTISNTIHKLNAITINYFFSNIDNKKNFGISALLFFFSFLRRSYIL
jgi:hypothetical protein